MGHLGSSVTFNKGDINSGLFFLLLLFKPVNPVRSTNVECLSDQLVSILRKVQ